MSCVHPSKYMIIKIIFSLYIFIKPVNILGWVSFKQFYNFNGIGRISYLRFTTC